jgi:hypothetical protein
MIRSIEKNIIDPVVTRNRDHQAYGTVPESTTLPLAMGT